MLGLNRGQRPRPADHDMNVGEEIEERYSKPIAAFAYEHDLDSRDMTPEQRGRFYVMSRAHRPLLVAPDGESRRNTATVPADCWLRAEFVRRLIRDGRCTDAAPTAPALRSGEEA